MTILELFSGSKSFTNASKLFGAKTFTVDIVPEYEPDLVADVANLTEADVPFKPDIVWASPPCTTFSVASISTHWTGGYRAYIPKTPQAKDAIGLIERTVALISELEPKYWYIENPRGVLRKVIPDILDEYLGTDWRRKTVTYCQYGDSRMKPTDIWTNDMSWVPRKMCKNGWPCHTPAPRGAKTGTQGLAGSYERSKVPKELCLEILRGNSREVTFVSSDSLDMKSVWRADR